MSQGERKEQLNWPWLWRLHGRRCAFHLCMGTCCHSLIGASTALFPIRSVLPVTSATMKSFVLLSALLLSGLTSSLGRKLAQVRGLSPA